MDIYTININRGFELCAARRRPPASIAIPVCQAGCTIASDTIVDRAGRYYKEEGYKPSLFFPVLCSKTAFPMFCLARRGSIEFPIRAQYRETPSNGRPRPGGDPTDCAFRLATSKWIKLRSAIDSSHAPLRSISP